MHPCGWGLGLHSSCQRGDDGFYISYSVSALTSALQVRRERALSLHTYDELLKIHCHYDHGAQSDVRQLPVYVDQLDTSLCGVLNFPTLFLES